VNDFPEVRFAHHWLPHYRGNAAQNEKPKSISPYLPDFQVSYPYARIPITYRPYPLLFHFAPKFAYGTGIALYNGGENYSIMKNLQKTLKGAAVALSIAFGLILITGTDASAQYRDNGGYNQRDNNRNDDRYDNQNSNRYRQVVQKGYQDGKQQAMRDARSRNNRNWNNNGYNGGYQNENRGYNSRNGGRSAYQSAYRAGFQRGYRETMQRLQSRNNNGRNGRRGY
jgi:hypothetical protein